MESLMEPALMMRTALALLTLAALGGLAMVVTRFSKEANPSSALAMAHGLLAGAALTLLLYAYFTVGLPAIACWSLVLLAIAAVGGTYLNLRFHANRVLLSKGIVVVHALAAVAGYLLLAWAVLGR
jgi:hypothetical protein